MANDGESKQEVPEAFDLDMSEPLSEAMSTAEQGRAALGRLRTMVDETAVRLEELSRATAVFEAVADRLVATTLKVSESITNGDRSHATAVAFVEELAELARRSLIASGNGRCQLREYEKTAVSTKVAAHEANAALDALTALLKQLADAPAASAVPVPIEVETRPQPPPPPPPVKDLVSASWANLTPKPSRFKN